MRWPLWKTFDWKGRWWDLSALWKPDPDPRFRTDWWREVASFAVSVVWYILLAALATAFLMAVGLL